MNPPCWQWYWCGEAITHLIGTNQADLKGFGVKVNTQGVIGELQMTTHVGVGDTNN